MLCLKDTSCMVKFQLEIRRLRKTLSVRRLGGVDVVVSLLGYNAADRGFKPGWVKPKN